MSCTAYVYPAIKLIRKVLCLFTFHYYLLIFIELYFSNFKTTHLFQCDDTKGCVMQFWPPDNKHMCSKHVEAWNKLIVKQKFCASSWLNTEINILRCTVSKTSQKKRYTPSCVFTNHLHNNSSQALHVIPIHDQTSVLKYSGAESLHPSVPTLSKMSFKIKILQISMEQQCKTELNEYENERVGGNYCWLSLQKLSCI